MHWDAELLDIPVLAVKNPARRIGPATFVSLWSGGARKGRARSSVLVTVYHRYLYGGKSIFMYDLAE